MKPEISVIGLGKLGLCTAACFAHAGFHVTGMDVRADHVKQLSSGETPFFEPGLSDLLAQTRSRLNFTTSAEEAISNSDIAFVIVPTPSGPDGGFINDYITAALHSMGPALREKDGFFIVDIVSTVMPGSCEMEFIPLLEQLTGKQVGQEIGLAYNPEFIAIGSVIENFLRPDLVLIGTNDQKTGDIIENVYAQTCKNSPYMARTNLINAEIAKLALNCFCTMKISFANNLASICDSVPNSNASEICKILGKDSRIGEKYIKPGLGFGGPCFPRDNEAFIRFAHANGGFTALQEAVVKINEMQTQRAINRIKEAVSKYGNKVAILGLSYKPGTYLTERSQALQITQELSRFEMITELRSYDPKAKVKGEWTQCRNLEECVKGVNVVAILTPWPEFKQTDWHHLLDSQHKILDFWKQEQI